ncbi:uncharacterized protein LOC141854055 [Brevipalpus obovatus]|uniref:uncharacterized protein LOC141854055 n=1 Tax=Brevipalpus obovatus TaxID=246614 RepID=UPI003D9EC51C
MENHDHLEYSPSAFMSCRRESYGTCFSSSQRREAKLPPIPCNAPYVILEVPQPPPVEEYGPCASVRSYPASIITYNHIPPVMSSCRSASSFSLSSTPFIRRCCTPTCCVILMIVLVVFATLITLIGISVYLGIITNLRKSTILPISGRFKVVSGDSFKPILYNTTSIDFVEKAQRYNAMLNSALHRTDIGKTMAKSEIYAFREGPLIVYFRIFLDRMRLTENKEKFHRKAGQFESSFAQKDDVWVPRLLQDDLRRALAQVGLSSYKNPRIDIDSVTLDSQYTDPSVNIRNKLEKKEKVQLLSEKTVHHEKIHVHNQPISSNNNTIEKKLIEKYSYSSESPDMTTTGPPTYLWFRSPVSTVSSKEIVPKVAHLPSRNSSTQHRPTQPMSGKETMVFKSGLSRKPGLSSGIRRSSTPRPIISSSSTTTIVPTRLMITKAPSTTPSSTTTTTTTTASIPRGITTRRMTKAPSITSTTTSSSLRQPPITRRTTKSQVTPPPRVTTTEESMPLNHKLAPGNPIKVSSIDSGQWRPLIPYSVGHFTTVAPIWPNSPLSNNNNNNNLRPPPHPPLHPHPPSLPSLPPPGPPLIQTGSDRSRLFLPNWARIQPHHLIGSSIAVPIGYGSSFRFPKLTLSRARRNVDTTWMKEYIAKMSEFCNG